MKRHHECEQVREYLLEAKTLAKKNALPQPLAAHAAACAECKGEIESMQQTWALLDEWQAPEPSAYFDQRLQARLREERAEQQQGVWAWLRPRWQPALAGA